jgi:hypothetical protein
MRLVANRPLSLVAAAPAFAAVLLTLTCCRGTSATGAAGGSEPDNPKMAAQGSELDWPAHAPERDACEKDSECTILVDGPAGPDPCCNVSVTALPMSIRFVQWMQAWRKENCSGVACPPLELPGALLKDCGYEPRCLAGRCTNSCSP